MEDKIIVLTTCPYSRSQLIKGQLESEGIECFLSNINLVQPGISTGVQIKIKESDVDIAFKIIEEIKHQSGAEKQKIVNKLRQIRRILVPVDFSEISMNACFFALALADKLKAEIKLLYSYYDPIIGTESSLDGEIITPYVDSFIDTIAYDAKRHLKELEAELKTRVKKDYAHDIIISSYLDRGAAEDVILQYEGVFDPGLIVMGTQGANRASGNFIGTICRKVIAKAKIPVLAIPPDANLKDTLAFQKILYATNFYPSDHVSLRKLMTLIRPFNLKIQCVHIAVDGYSPVDNARMETLDAYLKKEYPEFDVHCEVIGQKDIILGIQNYIVENKVGLIALTTHNRGIFERFFNPSIARKMLFHTEIPLLVFHE